MNKNSIDMISLRSFFKNDTDFSNAIDDALLLQKLKTPTKFSIKVEDLEEELKKSLKTKSDLQKDILFVNYKRFLYKHILELEKLQK